MDSNALSRSPNGPSQTQTSNSEIYEHPQSPVTVKEMSKSWVSRSPARVMDLPVSGPFLRWAGGKRWLKRALRDIPSVSSGKYLEPFLGSGVMFFAVRPRRAILSDINEELIISYQVVRDRLDELLAELAGLRNTKGEYERIRSAVPSDPVSRAARLIYLNKTAWNGLYRVNKHDGFNVPYGRYKSRKIVDIEGLKSASEALRGIRLLCSDFGTVLDRAKTGDLVYADPPYVSNGSKGGFDLYNVGRFSWDAQTRLAMALGRIDKKGVRFVVSNRDDPNVRELYRDFSIVTLSRASVIAGNPAHRRPVTELLISNFPIATVA
jgi:DNA adenine methylase